MNCVIESGPWNFGHLKPPRPGTNAPAKPMRGSPPVSGSAHPGIQTVSRRGRVQVAGQRGLVEAVIADARFVDPLCIRSPDPIASDHLSSGMDVGTPLRLQLGKIFDRSGVVAEEIHPADGVALVEVVIHFGNYVVDPHFVGKSLHDVDRSACC